MNPEYRFARSGEPDDVDSNLFGHFHYYRTLPPRVTRHFPSDSSLHWYQSDMETHRQHELQRPHGGWHDVISSTQSDIDGVTAAADPDAISDQNGGVWTTSIRAPPAHSPAVWASGAPGRYDYWRDTPLKVGVNSLQHQSRYQQQGSEGKVPKYTEIHDAFHLAHGGKRTVREEQTQFDSCDEQQPILLQHLFRRPVIRQFLHNGKLYREKFERESSRFELYFDLIFVGVAHLLADGLNESEGARALNVAKFALTLFPLWSLVVDVRTYINESGLDDVWSRLYLMLQMLIMVGYTANATACKIYAADEGVIASQEGERILSGRAESETSEHPLLVVHIGDTGCWFAEGYLLAITSAAAFYLLSKTIKLGTLFVYGLCLPKFRRPLWLRMVPVVCLAAIYVPIPAVPVFQPGWLTLLLCLGVGLDIISRYFVSYLTQWWHGRSKREKKQFYIPATSVEHLQERTVLYVLLFAGEAVLSSTYSASTSQIGVRGEFCRSALSIVTVTCFTWVYFDADASRVFVHALRRNPFTAITFNLLHYPLTGAFILLSSSLHRLIAEEESSRSYRWFYGAAMSCALLMTALIGLLHKNLDVYGSAKWSHLARIVLRVIVAAVYGVVPLLEGLSNAEFLAIYTALSVILVVSETLGKLGAVGRRFDAGKADAYYAALEREGQKRKWMEEDDEAATKGGEKHPSRGRRSGGEALELGERASICGRPTMAAAAATMTVSEAGLDGRGADFQAQQTSSVSRFLNPYTSHVRLSRRSSWHPYDDLTADEQGNEDVGVEGEIGQMEVKERLDKGQRWAMVSS